MIELIWTHDSQAFHVLWTVPYYILHYSLAEGNIPVGLKRGISYRISTLSDLLKKLTEEVALKRKLRRRSVWVAEAGEVTLTRDKRRHEGTELRSTWAPLLCPSCRYSLRSIYGSGLPSPCVLFSGELNHHCTFNSQIIFLELYLWVSKWQLDSSIFLPGITSTSTHSLLANKFFRNVFFISVFLFL